MCSLGPLLLHNSPEMSVLCMVSTGTVTAPDWEDRAANLRWEGVQPGPDSAQS